MHAMGVFCVFATIALLLSAYGDCSNVSQCDDSSACTANRVVVEYLELPLPHWDAQYCIGSEFNHSLRSSYDDAIRGMYMQQIHSDLEKRPRQYRRRRHTRRRSSSGCGGGGGKVIIGLLFGYALFG